MPQEIRADDDHNAEDESRLALPLRGEVLIMPLMMKTIAAAIALSAVAMMMPSPVAALSTKQAMALCRAKYGTGVTGVTIRKNGHIVCQEGPGPNATRQQVYDYCKKRHNATVVKVRKLSGGKWHCLHNGHF